MTERFHLPRSLDAKILYIIVLAVLCALLVYFVAYGLGTLALQQIYMSAESVSARQAAYYTDFNQFVAAYKVKGSDAQTIAHWTQDNAYVTLLVFQDGDLLLRAWDGISQTAVDMQSYERLLYATEYSRLYPMRFADGQYQIAIGDNTDAREDRLNWDIALLLSVISFFAVVLLYIHRLSRRVILLSREAGAIGAGDLDHPITVKGGDELAELATDVDNMRRSVIERMGNERRAWQANSELITAISHDIRTPMTTLIGYLGLLNESGFDDPEQGRQFAASAYDKAMELKDLTDELFRYFLVFGRSELDLNSERLDARLLLEQLLGEAEFDLSDAGFSVSRIEFEGECSVWADPLYLKRVLDNLVSNAKKYADRQRPILVLTELKNGDLSVCVSNYVARSMDRVESTKIGLRTCEKIMQAMGGSFTTTRDEEHFAAEFTLPAEAPV
ncbi:MAG: HAMP domain-containing histidine kinase [Oscillospiraceae bacterium]|nr:HAMP domain-containing histidine kinase [Oscillospiraceae bacterium]